MIKRIYSIRDIKSELFGPLMAFHRDGEAMRALDSTVNSNKDNQIAKNPEDFRLFFIGEFDEAKGTFTSHKPEPKLICDAMSFVKELQNAPLARQK